MSEQRSTLAFLQRARRRWALHALVRASLVGVLGGSSLILVLRLAEFTGAVARSWTPSESAWAAGAASFLAFVVRLVLSARRLPSLVAMGHHADRTAGLHNLLATGAELALSTSSHGSLVAQAALDDSDACASSLTMRDVLPHRIPRRTWLVPFVAGTALAVSVLGAESDVHSRGPGTATTAVGDPSGPSPSAGSIEHESVRRVADLLEREAASNDDPYLRAVAEAFQDVVRDLDASAEEASDLQFEVDPLLDHLARAVADRDDEVGNLLRELAESGLRTGPEPQTDGTAEEPSDAEGNMPELMRYSESPMPRRSTDDLLDQLDRATESAASLQPDSDPQASDSGMDEEMFYGGTFDDPGAPRTPSGVAQDGEAAGVPVGAAERSDDRAGDAAGGGGSDSDRGPAIDAFEAIDVEVDPLGLNEAHSDESGVRTEGDGLTERFASEPSAQRIEARDHGQIYRTGEGSIGAERLGTKYGSAVSRYFLPSESSPEGF